MRKATRCKCGNRITGCTCVTVTRAATLHNGMVFSMPRPNSHGAIDTMLDDVSLPATPDVAGFLLSNNAFVTRSDAGHVAYEAGQVDTFKPHLMSSDLWKQNFNNIDTW